MKAYSCVKVCAAPQAAEKTVNTKTVKISRDLRPNMSLSLDKIIKKPVDYQLSQRFVGAREWRTGISEEIRGHNPVAFPETVQRIGNGYQGCTDNGGFNR